MIKMHQKTRQLPRKSMNKFCNSRMSLKRPYTSDGRGWRPVLDPPDVPHVFVPPRIHDLTHPSGLTNNLQQVDLSEAVSE